jgi:hypothetical protein
MYDERDVYANRDLKIGQGALEDALALKERLERLPAYYRHFYRLRVLNVLEAPGGSHRQNSQFDRTQ